MLHYLRGFADSSGFQPVADLIRFGLQYTCEEIGPCGRSCTRTVSVLSGVSLLLDYAGMESGASGRNFARNLRVRSAALYTLSYESVKIGRPPG